MQITSFFRDPCSAPDWLQFARAKLNPLASTNQISVELRHQFGILGLSLKSFKTGQNGNFFVSLRVIKSA